MESKIDQINDPQIRAFAQDCLEMKTITELRALHLPGEADRNDLREWNITTEGWYEAIDAALFDSIQETESMFQNTLKVDEDIALGRWCASCKTPWGIATRWGPSREEALKKLHDNIMGLGEEV